MEPRGCEGKMPSRQLARTPALRVGTPLPLVFWMTELREKSRKIFGFKELIGKIFQTKELFREDCCPGNTPSEVAVYQSAGMKKDGGHTAE